MIDKSTITVEDFIVSHSVTDQAGHQKILQKSSTIENWTNFKLKLTDACFQQ
jgi:hypothetical protein